MRELDRHSTPHPPFWQRLAIVGPGRMGTALCTALRDAGREVVGPLGRGSDGAGADVVLLCVPDGEIAAAAAMIAPGPLLGHCSGATSLSVLGERQCFSMHPLMTVTHQGAVFAGAGAAVSGSTPQALEYAHRLARVLWLRPVEVAESDRIAYHAAASIASNLLVTLQDAAEQLAATAGVDRTLLLPLVRQTVENWGAIGAERALTGPIARGDEATVHAQRNAIAERTPELLELFDALAAATRTLAQRPAGVPS